MKKQGYPHRGELVVCEITKINPNSAFANLLEYEMTGMIHVSEVARRWVRNIREFVKQNQLLVCSVVRVDEADISLSIKRVSRSESERKLQEYKRERNAEKLLEQMGKKFNLNLENTYDEIGYKMQDEFGSLHRAFDIALRNPGLLTEKGIDNKWAEAIIEIANKSFSEKTYEVKADLMLSSFSPKGVDIIKEALVKLEGTGLEVRYISAPKYQLVGRGKNIKELKGLVASVSEQAIEQVRKAGGEGSFAIEE